jgi:nitrite reductase/ring-hydroxylating ferredoxin subunit
VAFRSLERLINLFDGYRRAFRIDGVEVLLVQEEGQRWIFGRRCPHAGQALDEAPVSADCVQCPRHGYRFSLQDGSALGPPCASLPVYTVVYEGNRLGVDDRRFADFP